MGSRHIFTSAITWKKQILQWLPLLLKRTQTNTKSHGFSLFGIIDDLLTLPHWIKDLRFIQRKHLQNNVYHFEEANFAMVASVAQTDANNYEK